MLQSLRNASIGVKVTLAPMAAVVCLLIVAGLGAHAIGRLSAAIVDMRETSLPALVQVEELRHRVAVAAGTVNQSLAWTGAEASPERIAPLDKRVAAELKAIGVRIAEMQQLPLWDDNARQRLKALQGSYAALAKSATDALDMKDSGLNMAAPFLVPLQDKVDKVDAELTALAESERQRTNASAAAAVAMGHTQLAVIAAGGVAALLAAGLAAALCARLIVRPLREARALAEAVADGNLAPREAHALQADETGLMIQAMASVADNLRHTVADIRQRAHQVADASGEIAQGNADLSVRSEERAAHLQQAASAVELLSRSAQDSAAVAERAEALARQASDDASGGQEQMSRVVQRVEELGARSRQIADIVGVIDGIAFQTNLLALNAAVEAARAGSQGRGFAVVAGEVRELAQRAAASARDIRTQIGASVTGTQEVSALVGEAGARMLAIVGQVHETTRMIGDIAQTSRTQSARLADVSTTVTQLDRSAQADAALVEQAAATAQSLRQQADDVNALLGRFRLEATSA